MVITPPKVIIVVDKPAEALARFFVVNNGAESLSLIIVLMRDASVPTGLTYAVATQYANLTDVGEGRYVQIDLSIPTAGLEMRAREPTVRLSKAYAQGPESFTRESPLHAFGAAGNGRDAQQKDTEAKGVPESKPNSTYQPEPEHKPEAVMTRQTRDVTLGRADDEEAPPHG